MSGYVELKPCQDQANSLFQPLGFTFPQPTGRGKYIYGLFVSEYILTDKNNFL